MSQVCFRVLSERYLTSEIDFVRWNPKYDLLAVATKRGDIILQRLFWKKAWQISSSSSDSGSSATRISSLLWSPNGKHLAIVYSTGRMCFVEVESGRIVHQVDGQVSNGTTSKWMELKKVQFSGCEVLFDDGDDLLLPLPPVDKSKASSATTSIGEPVSFASESQNSSSLSLLTVGDDTGFLRLFLNGFFHVADLNLRNFLLLVSDADKENIGLMPAALDLTPGLDRLAVALCKHNSGHLEKKLQFAIFKTPLSFNRPEYWIRIAKRVSHLSSALSYVEATVQKLCDSWEDPAAELDTKLAKYASSKDSEGTIGDDFIRMLVFGVASQELEHFLTRTLTDKGLKKLLGTVENAYQVLFTVLGVNLDCAVSALYHHVTALHNLLALDDDEGWAECIETTASLSLKVTHLHDVAESHARSIGLFLRWLHRCIVTVSDESLPSSLSHFSDEDVDNVAKFIQENFCKTLDSSDDSDDTTSARFGLEKLGVYLKSETEIICDSRISDKSKIFIAHRSLDSLSLPDCVKMVHGCVSKIQDRLSTIFSRRFIPVGQTFSLYLDATSRPAEEVSKNVCLAHDPENHCFRLVCAVEENVCELFVTEFNDESAALSASWKLSSTTSLVRHVMNLDQYKTAIVIALIRERDEDETDWKYYLYQIDASSLKMPSSPSKCVGSSGRSLTEPISVPWNLMKNQRLNEGQFCNVSVSGSRKVGCVIFACHTRLKLLEMEPDDDMTADSSSYIEQNSAMEVGNE